MSKRSPVEVTLSALFLVLLSISPVFAAGTTAISFDDVTSVTSARYTLGYEFTPTVDVSVTELGFYDYGNNGLGDDHPVGIFRVSDQTLIVSETVLMSDPASGDTPNGFFRYRALGTPVTLSAGTAYRIAAVAYGLDTWPYANYTNLTGDPLLGVVTGSGNYISGDTLVYPSNTQVGEFYGIANFRFVVPEPASLVLCTLGGAALLARRRA